MKFKQKQFFFLSLLILCTGVAQADVFDDISAGFQREIIDPIDKLVTPQSSKFDWQVENKTNVDVVARVYTFNTDYGKHHLGSTPVNLEPGAVLKPLEQGDYITTFVNRWCVEVSYHDTSGNAYVYYNKNKECNVEARDITLGRITAVEIHGGPEVRNPTYEQAKKANEENQLSAKIVVAKSADCDVKLEAGNAGEDYCPSN